jgi:hypothetical protein
MHALHSQQEADLSHAQRKTSKHGDGLGKTTGWIHRSAAPPCAVSEPVTRLRVHVHA